MINNDVFLQTSRKVNNLLEGWSHNKKKLYSCTKADLSRTGTAPPECPTTIVTLDTLGMILNQNSDDDFFNFFFDDDDPFDLFFDDDDDDDDDDDFPF